MMNIIKPVYNHGIAVIRPEINNDISGIIRFDDMVYEDIDLVMCKISVNLQGVPDGEHGFHIHEKGDLSKGCESVCTHYNPANVVHGSIYSGHVGDLGNLISVNSQINTTLFATRFTTDEIIGRSIVLHEKFDDLGKGKDTESLKTGNSGKRIACAVIGIV